MEKFFIIFSFLIIISTIITITSLNPIHSVFWLVITFIQASFIILALGFEFIGIILVIIYVGAIAILFLFVVMMLDVLQLSEESKILHLMPILLIVSCSMFLSNKINFSITEYYSVDMWKLSYESQLQILGSIFYSDYAISFILMSILLLIAMIAAIILTLDLGQITRRQNLSTQHQRNNSWT